MGVSRERIARWSRQCGVIVYNAGICGRSESKSFLRMLARHADRQTNLFDVPTVAKSGLPGYDIVAWFGIVAPA